MRERVIGTRAGSALFDGLGHSPHQHFTLYFYAALLRALDQAALHFGSAEAADRELPFLAGYFEQIAERGLESASFEEAHARWREGIIAWESSASVALPLMRLRAAANLEFDDLTLLAQIGLPDEDPRLGFLFDAMHGVSGDRRASLGLLASGWQREPHFDARAAAHRLQRLGLIEPAPGITGALRPTPLTWEVLRGADSLPPCDWVVHRPRSALPELDRLVLPESVRAECDRACAALTHNAVTTVIIRGPHHNGRSTVAAALARGLGRGTLRVRLEDPADPRWAAAATLACLLDAAIILRADSAANASFPLPTIPDGMAPLFVTAGSGGGISGEAADRALTLHLPVPGQAAREQLWRDVLGPGQSGLPFLRLTSGNIVRAGRVAKAASAQPDAALLRASIRTLERSGLEALARRVDPPASAARLAVAEQTALELQMLESRCRQRERLAASAGAALAELRPGVRALLKGPSGTGKTLAARLLARTLEMELYRVDLAAVVNKYIGETEKNLERVFAGAEELDVILLLDEGDALLTQRTGVQSANDRYANLETNYLLQRLETYDGILLVTTNAGDRIDSAFQRRMDVIVDFQLPDVAERWEIWQQHLPDHHHVPPDVLQDVAQRCPLPGGQIRNIALHATLLALDESSTVQSRHLETAIERQYRKLGSVSPLRLRR